MAYGDFKYLTRGTASDKISRDKAFNIAKNKKIIDIKGHCFNSLKKFL